MKNMLFGCSRSLLPALLLLLFFVAPATSAFAFDDFGNHCEDAAAVPANGWIDGYLETPNDRDVFRIDVTASGLLAVEVSSLGREAGAPRLTLLDGGCRRTTAAAAARQVATLGAAGTFFVEVRGGGAVETAYRLQSGFAAESRPTDLWLQTPDGAGWRAWRAAPAGKIKELEEDVDEVEPIVADPAAADKDCEEDCPEEDVDEVEPLVTGPPVADKDCEEDCPEEDVDEVEPLLPVIHLRLAAAVAPPGNAGLATKDCEDDCPEEDVDEVEPIVAQHPSPDKDCEEDCPEEDVDEVEPIVAQFPADKDCEEDCPEEDVDEVEPLLPDLEIDLLAPGQQQASALGAAKDCEDDCPEEDVDEVEPIVAGEPGVLAVQLVSAGGKRLVSERGYVTLRAGAYRVASELRAAAPAPRVWARLYRVCPRLAGDDHGESFGCATALTLGERLAGDLRHGAIDDRDAFAFDLVERRTVALEADGHVDTFGALYDADGALIAADDDGGDGVGFRLEVTLEPGRYYLRVTGVGGEEGAYTLTTADLSVRR